MVPVEMLTKAPMFQGLSEDHLEDIAEISHRQEFEAGATIFLEGQQADKLYILVEGKVALEMKVHLDPNQAPRHTIIDVLAPGETFAWSALVEPHKLLMSARCVKHSSVVAVDAASLRKLMTADCGLGFTILQRLSEIIGRRLTDTRAQLVGERGLALMYDSLRDSC